VSRAAPERSALGLTIRLEGKTIEFVEAAGDRVSFCVPSPEGQAFAEHLSGDGGPPVQLVRSSEQDDELTIVGARTSDVHGCFAACRKVAEAYEAWRAGH
jgi:hypothetical protein